MNNSLLPPQIAKLRLVAGKGNYSAGTACTMSATVALDRLRKGEPLGEATDELECVCPVIRRLVIGRNDGWWPSGEARTEWGLKLIPKLLDTRVGPERTVRRVFRVADVTVRKIAPITLRAHGYQVMADQLERLAPIVDRQTAMAARSAVYTAANAATASAVYAADSTDYVVYAADAADYACATTSAAADAAAYAASAASAAYYADAAAASAAYAAYCTAYYAKAATWSHIEQLIEEFVNEPRD